MPDDKQANNIGRRKAQGFINHLVAVGEHNEAQITKLHGGYKKQDGKRTEKNLGLREALIGKK